MKIRIIACLSAIVLTAPAAAQEPVDANMIARIRAEGLDRSQIGATFDMLTNIIGPRLTGSPAHKRAADWTREKLAGWGMSNAHLESWEFGRGWTLEKLTLEMVAPRYFPLIGYPEAWTPSTKGILEAAPVYIGDMSLDQVRGLGNRIRGAIVLISPPQTNFITENRPQPADAPGSVRIGAPPTVGVQGAIPTRQLMPVLQELGAAVALRPNQGEHGTIFVLGNRATPNDAVPVIVLASEHYNMLVSLSKSASPAKLRVEVGVRYHEQDPNSYNVIAEIPGTDPALRDEVVLIGAHLDSWHSATGATDNADAAAAVMEAMRILKAIGAQPRRTIRVALWSGEEEGLLGSKAYVDQHLAGDANAAARDKLYVYLNDDPGTGATYGFYLEQNAAVKPIFDAWLAPLRDLGAKKNVMEGIGSTDHLSFTRAGMPGFNTIKDYADYDVRTHHTNTDFPERIAEQDLKQSAIVLAVFAYQAAMREGKLPKPVS
jgi:carboxypeptidase Q